MAETLEEIKPEVDLRLIGKNMCQSVRLCPASQYTVCGCMTLDHENHNKNCWDLGGKPCCKRDSFQRCLTCEIYLEACDVSLAESK